MQSAVVDTPNIVQNIIPGIDMKLVCISDTHNRHDKIGDFHSTDNFGNAKEPLSGDLIIHAGDATGQGSVRELKQFLEWYSKLDFKYKIFVSGNHDFGCETNPELYKQMCTDLGIIMLNHESVVIDGIKIFGSPWTPWFHDWAFNAGRTVNEAAHYKKPFIGDLWAQMPKDTNILVTHGPPYDILDECPDGRRVGCQELSKRISLVKLDLHFFGHIHHSQGELHQDGTSYYNVCICDERYYASNPVTIVEYKK